MSKILRVEIALDGAAFEDDRGEAGRILRELSVHEAIANWHPETDANYGRIDLRDINGNVCGSAVIVEAEQPRRLRGHTLLIGGEMVTLWPVEIAGAGTLPPQDCTEPLVWFNHTEGDWTEPYSVLDFAFVNRWGWAYASRDVSEAVKASGGYIELKRRDSEALRDCGSANAELMRKS